MKKLLLFKSFLFLLPMLSLAQVGVNTTTPNAMLDISSTTNGILIPRVALTSALAAAPVVNPQGGALATSTLIYNTATAGVSPNNVFPGFYYWDGSRWIPISGTKDWTLGGNTGTTSPAFPATYGTSAIGPTENFIGTTDDNDVVFATNNLERLRIERTTGAIGIGTSNPSHKFHVRDYSPTAAIFGHNMYTGSDDDPVGVAGIATSAVGLGVGGSFMGNRIGVQSDVVLSTGYTGTTYGIFARSMGSLGTRVGGYFSATGGTNNYALVVPPGGGNTGLGTSAPTNTLHVAGTVRIADGSQGAGKVLTSSATGVASWQSQAIDNVVGVLSASGCNIAYNTANYLQTGSYITLPPGKFAVNISMLLARNSAAYSPNNSFFWVRTSFSTSSAPNPTPSADIVGSDLASGNFPGSSIYAMLNGTIVINNTSAGNRTYYYIAGATVANNTTETLQWFGSTVWAENNIIAYRLN